MILYYGKALFKNGYPANIKNKVQYLLSIVGIAIGLLCFSMTSYYIRRFNSQFTAWSNNDRMANLYVKSEKKISITNHIFREKNCRH